MKKPKLLLVADTFYPKVDGILKFMEEFMRRAPGFQINLLVPDLGERRRGVIYVKPSSFISLSGYPGMKLSCNNIARIKKAVGGAEVIFIQGPGLISYLSMYYGHKYGKKTVFYMHVLPWELLEKFAPWPFRGILAFLTRKIAFYFYNRCDLILVPYHNLVTQLYNQKAHTEIRVARLGVDIERFTPSKDRADSKKQLGLPQKRIIGYVGRISREKNTHLLLEALRNLKKSEQYHLLLVGDGPRGQTEVFRKNPQCTVTGFVKDVPRYLQAMDIFVMPSLTETTSLATLEAMACGLPVIATKVGFIQNYVQPHNGLFFPGDNAAALVRKIEGLTDKEAEKLGRQARKTVAYSFSWERSINKIIRLLQGTLEGINHK